jgi:H+/Cl- antiporter ClcA
MIHSNVLCVTGEKYWLWIPSGAGLVCGILRFFMSYPETVDGMYKEISHFHVDWKIAPQTIFLSLISLACGASLGPEQALVRVFICLFV